MTMSVVARVYIVRHGETDYNREGIVQGHLDCPLNAAGVVQARFAADALELVRFSAAFSSDLQRARTTAEIILEKHPDIQLETAQALRERFMGDWQGGSIAKRGDPPANLEPIQEFTARGMRWWDDVVVRRVGRKAAEFEDVDRDGKFEPEHILVVSHGGLIGALVRNLVESRKLGVENGVVVGRYRCFNASITVVEIHEDLKGQLVSYADTTHLNVDLVQYNADVQP